MHMSGLTRRTQILLDEERYERLERRAAESGRSVAAIIREAIDHTLGFDDEVARRTRAGAAVLAAEPMPVEDWPALKADMLDSLHAGE